MASYVGAFPQPRGCLVIMATPASQQTFCILYTGREKGGLEKKRM